MYKKEKRETKIMARKEKYKKEENINCLAVLKRKIPR